MSIFKTKGFDTVISKDTLLVGELCFSGVTVVDGTIEGKSVKQNTVDTKPSSLHVNGTVKVDDVIVIHDLTICGTVTAKEIRVDGILAIKKGCKVQAERILYRTLVAEPGAIILGTMVLIDDTANGSAL
jgi:cytoskeletal protein CcmA (bactofilin family)